ncbi:MAG: hypothetical protein ACUVYA_15665 [Planctomycetota bacterium]
MALALLAPAGLAGETAVGGRLETQEWTRAGSPYRAVADLEVPAGATLTIGPGVDVLFERGVSVSVRGAIVADGTELEPVRWLAARAGEPWGGVLFRGAAASANLEHLEVTGCSRASVGGTEYPAAINGENGAKLRLRHCWLHEFPAGVIDVRERSELVLLDSLVENSLESVHTVASYTQIEGCHIRNITGHSDLIDLDYESTPRSVIRKCILENSVNDDAIDLQGSSALVEDCVLRGMINGKAVSIDLVCKPVLRGLVVYDSLWGLVVKDKATATFERCTVTRCDVGIKCYEKNPGAGGGHAVADSMILWGNRKAVEVDALSSLSLSYSIVEGGHRGEGNLDADPLFADAGAGDFRPLAGSPAVGSGKDGGNMGALAPVPAPEGSFVRGDANRDGAVDVADAVALILWLFAASVEPPCLDSLDADDSGAIDITDAVHLLRYLFLAGPPPRSPFPDSGPDPTPDDPYGCAAP